MLPREKEELPTSEAIQREFTSICNDAIAGNRQTLEARLVVDLQVGLDTPVYQLAKAGQHAAVDLLVDHAGANINQAVLGFMERGYFAHAQALLAKGADWSFALNGAIQYGFDKIPDSSFKTRLLYVLASANNQEKLADDTGKVVIHSGLYQLICGYASVGDELNLSHLQSAHERNALLIQAIAYVIYATDGRDNLIDMAVASRIHDNINYSPVSFGYAMVGSKKVDKIINECDYSNRNGRKLILGAAAGYAASGQIEKFYAIFSQTQYASFLPGEVIHLYDAFLLGGHIEHAERLKSLCGYQTNTTVVRSLNLVVKHNKLYNKMINDFMISNEYLFRNKRLVESDRDLQTLASGMLSPISSPTTFLRLLSHIDSSILIQSITSYHDMRWSEKIPIMHAALKMNTLMRELNLSFGQLLVWRQSFLRGWIFNGIQLIKQGKLNMDILVMIASKASGLSPSDSRELIDKMRYYYVRLLLLHGLKGYTDGYFNQDWSLKVHKDRARSFQGACNHAGTPEKLKGLVAAQFRLFQPGATGSTEKTAEKHEKSLANSKRDEYFDVIHKAAQRLG